VVNVVKVAVVPDPVRYASNLYLYYLYDGMDAEITGPHSLTEREKPDILHVHFPDHALSVPVGAKMVGRTFYLFAILILARLRRVGIIWTVHNIQSHHPQPARLTELFYRKFSDFLDGLVFHSHGMRAACLRCYLWLADRPSAVVRHPAYPVFPLRPEERSPIERLGIAPQEFVVSIVGSIRANKNLVRVARDFIRLTPNWTLVIGGYVIDHEVDTTLRHIIAGQKGIHYLPRFLSEGEFDAIVAASDVVAVPYGALHTSGVAIRVLAKFRKVLALSSPEMVEIHSLLPSMVRLVDSVDRFWSALPQSRGSTWDGSAVIGLPDEFSPQHCQHELARFYRLLASGHFT
jgi:glycosyltransferase involved in cell wall biosynthesis